MHNHNKSRKARVPKRPKQQGRKKTGTPRTVISRTPFLMPERYSAKLTFATTINLLNVGFKDATYVLRPTSVYDVDPAIGGASAYGLAEFSQFYSRYKVHSSTIHVDCSNLDSQPMTFFLTPSLTNPGNNVSDIGPWFASTASRQRSLGPFTGNAASTLRHSYATQTLSGVDFFAEDGYASDVNNNPTLNTYWVLGAVKAGPGNMVNGIALVVKLVLTVHFYGRKPLVSPAAKLHRNEADEPYPAPIPVYLTTPPPSTLGAVAAAFPEKKQHN